MIDLHFHILPGLDDGPRDLRRSLELARAAQADGIQMIAATPHLREDHPAVHPPELAARCAELNATLKDADVAVEIITGGELDVLWVQQATEDQIRLVSYGQRGDDVLLETPYGPIGPTLEAAIERLWSLGYRVLLAHPERNRTFQRDPQRLADLVRRGLLVQLTAASLATRERRSRSRALAFELIEHGLAHVIASDAHSAVDFRPPDLSTGVAAVAEIDGELARWMVIDAPLAVLAGASLSRRPG